MDYFIQTTKFDTKIGINTYLGYKKGELPEEDYRLVLASLERQREVILNMQEQ